MDKFSPAFLGALAVICAMVIIVVAGASAFVVTQERIDTNSRAQQQSALTFEANLCKTLDALKSEKPPAGDAATNPSRAFEQQQHAALAQLAADIGCPAVP